MYYSNPSSNCADTQHIEIWTLCRYTHLIIPITDFSDAHSWEIKFNQ